ncbi:hypothetical protein JCM10908_001547 [Rhodotorula pacifica]|uniref:S8 family peptidase n=1 Tax=Rhodotorula pacifica TaxID=1495444 RepID=UPI00317F0754
MHRHLCALAATALAWSAGVANSSPIDSVRPPYTTLAPLYTPPPPHSADNSLVTNEHIIRDSYIVVLEDHLEPDHVAQHHAHVRSLHARHHESSSLVDEVFEGIRHTFHVGGKRHHHLSSRDATASATNSPPRRKQLKGYSGHFPEPVVDQIRALKGVKYVERDSIVKTQDVENGAPWGLARISHRKTLSFGTFSKYEYEHQGGEGVDAYVIDTGVNIDHVELEGRARWGTTVPRDPDQDLNGHGSHVAGTIASREYGVAKRANIVAVKVLGAGGSGSMSDVVKGVAWAADSAAEQANLKAKGKNPKHKGSVANMSLGGGKSQALDDAVDAAVDDGLHFAVAAGNDNRDACSYSPAAAQGAITVGASTIGDERAYFSNYGKCVDIFAPGLNIRSIWNTGNRSVNSISGTSMASPHIAGLAAYLLGTEWAANASKEEALALQAEAKASTSFATALGQIAFGQQRPFVGKPEDHLLSPKALKKHMIEIGTPKVLTDIGDGSPNVLSFNDWTAPKKSEGDEESSVPSKQKPEGKWRFEKNAASSLDEKIAASMVEKLQDELESLRSEIRAEVDEVAELVRELAEDLAMQ